MEIFTFWGKNVLKKDKRRKSINFLKERINHNYGGCFHETNDKFENISLMFSSYSHSHPGNLQPNTIIVSDNWLGRFNRNLTSILGLL